MLLLTTADSGTKIALAGTLLAGIIRARFSKEVEMMTSVYATSLAFSITVSIGPMLRFAKYLILARVLLLRDLGKSH